jgi:membrane-associated PAP2 superfamily phosphatase
MRAWPAALLLALAGAAIAAFHGSAADVAATAFFFDPASATFPLKDSRVLAIAGHTALKWIAIVAWVACVAAGGAWRRGAIYALAIAALASLLKAASPWSCPWDLPLFGGAKPGAGGCLPAAHPLSGFAFYGVAAALWHGRPRAAGAVLAVATLVGIAAGAVQVARGAHFVSHALAAAWIAAAVALAGRMSERRGRIML